MNRAGHAGANAIIAAETLWLIEYLSFTINTTWTPDRRKSWLVIRLVLTAPR
jgi:hypothetical protein